MGHDAVVREAIGSFVRELIGPHRPFLPEAQTPPG